MGDSRVGSPKSRRNSRDFDLSEFPPLGESMGAIAGASGAAVATAGTGAVKAGLGSGTAWKLFDPSLVFFPPLEKNGRMVVTPPKQVLVNGAKQWDKAFLGNFFGKSPPLSVFQKTANKLWGREGSVEIRFLAPSVYMINFPSQRVRDWVLEPGPWHIQNRAIVLRRWMPTGLGYLASAIGKPLYTDKATVLKQQLEFAKVCVEVEASSTLPSSILVDLGEGNSVDVDGGTPMGDLQVDLGIDRGRREEVVGSVNKSGVDLVFPVDSGACVDVQATGIGVVENA
ncbi:hypothetical protein V6N13_046646 [Hibiscus sabdariffa]